METTNKEKVNESHVEHANYPSRPTSQELRDHPKVSKPFYACYHTDAGSPEMESNLEDDGPYKSVLYGLLRQLLLSIAPSMSYHLNAIVNIYFKNRPVSPPEFRLWFTTFIVTTIKRVI